MHKHEAERITLKLLTRKKQETKYCHLMAFKRILSCVPYLAIGDRLSYSAIDIVHTQVPVVVPGVLATETPLSLSLQRESEKSDATRVGQSSVDSTSSTTLYYYSVQ